MLRIISSVVNSPDGTIVDVEAATADHRHDLRAWNAGRASVSAIATSDIVPDPLNAAEAGSGAMARRRATEGAVGRLAAPLRSGIAGRRSLGGPS